MCKCNWVTSSLGQERFHHTHTHTHTHSLMAVSCSQLCFSLFPRISLPLPRTLSRTVCLSGGHEHMLGDFGGRDPFPAEIASKFGEKTLGNFDSEHKILIPNLSGSAFSLARLECSPLQDCMSKQDAQALLRKVIGWRLLDEGGGLKLQCLWKLRDFKCGVELINRIYSVVEVTNHFPNLHLEQPNQVRAELWTSSIGGLTMNDFIVAAKIDEIKTSDFVSKKRAWA